MPACLYTSGRVYWVLSMGGIHRTPHLAHVVLLSVISSSRVQSDSIALTIYQYSQYSVSACYKLVTAFSYLSNQYLSCSDYIIAYLLCSVICYFSCILSCMLSTFQVLTHTCATSSRDVGSSSQHPDHA